MATGTAAGGCCAAVSRGRLTGPQSCEALSTFRGAEPLNTLWEAFKADVDRPSLDGFDAVVANLDRWEDLRYGGFPIGIPITMVFMMRRGPFETWSDEPQDEYVVVLEDIDELFAAMVAAARINPTFLGERHRLKPAMREWYAKDNDHSMGDVFRIDPPARN